jgi:CHAT domain-containing protein
VKLLLIAAERAHNLSLPPLRFVPQEIRTITEVASVAKVSALTADKATTSARLVVSLQAANFVHLACHGIQHSSEPHKSEFSLSSGSLTVSQLMAIDLKDAFFAFLSACETAKGDRKHADEVVHLAATMLFAGFKSVVATMW